MDELIQKFLAYVKLPEQKADKPFILGIIGNIGSGKTLVAQELVQVLPGAVVVQSNSARYILKEAGEEWGENVHQLVSGVAKILARDGYAVILDGGTADAADRQRIKMMAASLNVPFMFLRVRCENELCRLRTQRKYEDPSWESNFDDFRVNTTEKMLQNVTERGQVHHALNSNYIDNLVAEIDGNGPAENIQSQIRKVAEKIAAKLE